MEAQYIYNNRQIEYVILPYSAYLKLTGRRKATPKRDNEDVLIPQEVIELRFLKGMTKVAAWRKHLKISQRELAMRTGMTQGAISQIEKSGSNHRGTLEKLARAMNISVAQLSD